MAFLFKPSVVYYVDARGKRVAKDSPGARKVTRVSTKWYAAGPPLPAGKKVPLATDKVAAQQILAELVTRIERETATERAKQIAEDMAADQANKIAEDLAACETGPAESPPLEAALAAKPLLLRQSAACEYLGLSRTAWFRLRAAGRLPPPVALPGTAMYWRVADLDRWVDSLNVDTKPRRRHGHGSLHPDNRGGIR